MKATKRTWLVIDDLITDDHVVPVGPELVEREDVEPGAFISGRVEVDPHRVLLQQRRKPFVDRQVLVGLQVQQLEKKTLVLVKSKRDWSKVI